MSEPPRSISTGNGPSESTHSSEWAGSRGPGSGPVRRPVNPEAVHAGVLRVAPVGQNLDLDDLEGLVVLLKQKQVQDRSLLSNRVGLLFNFN